MSEDKTKSTTGKTSDSLEADVEKDIDDVGADSAAEKQKLSSDLVRRSQKYEGRSKLIRLMFDGGTIVDAIMMEASQQVGQSLLSLPWIFSLMGPAATIVLIFVFSAISIWTNHLLIALLTEFRHEIASQDDPRAKDPHYIASYHDVVGHFCGKKWEILTRVSVFFALIGLCVAQIVATASNLYLLTGDGISKRALTLIVGGVFFLISFVPTSREYRLFSVLALVATFYTAWYFTVDSIVTGKAEDVTYEHASSIEDFFLGFTALLFMFGGHSAVTEKADVMNDTKKYDIAYIFAIIYTYLITLPNGIATYRSYGSECQSYSNAFYLFPDTAPRDVAVVLMAAHEFVAFGLFASPLFHVAEKSFSIHGLPLIPVRIFVRFIIVGFFVLLATMFPFFGVINGFFSAFSTTFCSFIIPCSVYNLTFSKRTAEDSSYSLQKPPPAFLAKFVSPQVIRYGNWFIVLATVVCGVGLGGYASIDAIIQNAHKFSIFPKCYECN